MVLAYTANGEYEGCLGISSLTIEVEVGMRDAAINIKCVRCKYDLFKDFLLAARLDAVQVFLKHMHLLNSMFDKVPAMSWRLESQTTQRTSKNHNSMLRKLLTMKIDSHLSAVRAHASCTEAKRR